MTRQEIADLLELVIANYPKTFIKDAKATLSVWEMAFGDEPAERVYRAARHHMDVSKDFPTVAHIREAMNKGEMIYGNQPKVKTIEAPNTKIQDKLCTGAWACPYFEGELCYGTKEEQDNCYI